ncbi:adenine phosphoribosyltransferase [Williamsia sp. D3]|uniref:adenine phosphoribosyltransferase n=1 Tax=Williamsia sp. D3 TaxID=1313067 RepID=UPI0003D3A6FE|nr:adenine phosphoribosyltransferase [Williamsia sp. D3]ETD31996.1 adenine phosphoribosyltransferase [Williamsia sp. D3]
MDSPTQTGREAHTAREASSAIERLTRKVADFPSPGVQFKDLSPVLADPAGLRAVIAGLADCDAGQIDLVAGIDARGFLLGSGVALELGTGVLAVRKAGKLPPPVLMQEYTLEYGSACLEIPADGLDLTGMRVLIVDDVLATGGTVIAAIKLLRQAGAIPVAVAVVMELGALGGRAAVSEAVGDIGLSALTPG